MLIINILILIIRNSREYMLLYYKCKYTKILYFHISYTIKYFHFTIVDNPVENYVYNLVNIHSK